MTYQALYRVYRPQRFDDIVGQETITRTLKHAIAENKTSHAYLFTGPRGTGKTSAAKIFSKAINCPHQQDGEPCNQCDICQAITKGALNDVIEIDAASNNGVEEIRDIREKANYAPTQASYKVYIIDEVHMLSQGAFNALLKTLEEPPAHVIFILATTEPHKIPLTIISRTQRFDFKRINEKSMVDRMEQVMAEEDQSYEPEVLALIAQAAEGGMRDALSILDQTISFADGQVTEADALLVTGALTQELLEDYIQALNQGDAEEALTLLQEVLKEGKDPQRFTDDVIIFCRDVLVHQQSPNEQELLKRARLTEAFQELSQALDPQFLYDIIRVFNRTQHDLRLSNHAPVYLEVATIQLTQADLQKASADSSAAGLSEADLAVMESMQKQLTHLQAEMKKLEESTPTKLNQTASRSAPKKSKATSSGKISFQANKTQIFEVLKEATREDLKAMKELWPDLLNALPTTGRALIRASQPVAASPSGAVISFQYDILSQKASENEDLEEEMNHFIQKIRGQSCRLVYVTEKQWPNIRQDFINQMKSQAADSSPSSDLVEEADQEEQKEEEEKQEVVDQALELFGEDVVHIKDE